MHALLPRETRRQAAAITQAVLDADTRTIRSTLPWITGVLGIVHARVPCGTGLAQEPTTAPIRRWFRSRLLRHANPAAIRSAVFRVTVVARVVDADRVAIVFAGCAGEPAARGGLRAVSDLHDADLGEGVAALAQLAGPDVGCQGTGGEATAFVPGWNHAGGVGPGRAARCIVAGDGFGRADEGGKEREGEAGELIHS